MFGWFGVIKGLLGFVSGPITNITNKIVDYKIQLAKTQTEEDRIELQEHVATLQAQRDVMIAEASTSHLNSFIRLGFALPCIIYLWQVVVYDKIVSVWITGATHDTDDLSGGLWKIVLTVIGFYFLTVMTTHIIPARKT